jgi:hypothetical protein
MREKTRAAPSSSAARVEIDRSWTTRATLRPPLAIAVTHFPPQIVGKTSPTWGYGPSDTRAPSKECYPLSLGGNSGNQWYSTRCAVPLGRRKSAKPDFQLVHSVIKNPHQSRGLGFGSRSGTELLRVHRAPPPQRTIVISHIRARVLPRGDDRKSCFAIHASVRTATCRILAVNPAHSRRDQPSASQRHRAHNRDSPPWSNTS